VSRLVQKKAAGTLVELRASFGKLFLSHINVEK
jgi:hypothetical protein